MRPAPRSGSLAILFFAAGLVCGCGAPGGRDSSNTPTPSSTPMTDATPRPDRIGFELVDRQHALPADHVPADLVEVGPGYEAGRRYELRREAAEAWTRMHAAARDAGIALRVVSAYRSFERQQAVFDDAVRRMGAEQDSVARPGHSEHQLGTAVDIAGSDNETVLKASFADTDAGRWLLEHAPDFGFAISYTEANRAQTGYIPEPWHYRYVGPGLAASRHRSALDGR